MTCPAAATLRQETAISSQVPSSSRAVLKAKTKGIR